MSVSSELITVVFTTANWMWRDVFGTVLPTAAYITLKTINVSGLYFVHLIWSMYIELVNMTEMIHWLRRGLYLLCASQLVYCCSETRCKHWATDGVDKLSDWNRRIFVSWRGRMQVFLKRLQTIRQTARRQYQKTVIFVS